MATLLFYVFGILAVISALMVITRRNPMYSAISLLATFVSIAALYILLNAQFIAVIQITVYAGAILVLILFVIMLLNQKEAGEAFFDITSTGQRVAAILLAAAVLFEFIYAVMLAYGRVAPVQGIYSDETIASAGNVQSIGHVLFTQYLWPFEVISILLLVAIIGAVVLTRHEPSEGHIVMPDGTEKKPEDISEEGEEE